jgi:flavin-dependent dehydrogenase
VNKSLDVLVVGGGPAGSAASICLQRMGYKIQLVDCGGVEFKPGESLPPSIKPLLRELDAMAAISPDTALISYGNQSAWGSSELTDTDFIRDPNGCGWHVDRLRFDKALRDLAAEAGVDVREGMRAREREARWVVDCSGRAACFARRRGGRRVIYDRLVAAVAVFEGHGGDRDSRTLVESAPDGWWYTSIVPGGRRIAAFHTDAGSEELRTARSIEGFLRQASTTLHIRERLERNGYRMKGKPYFAAAHTTILDRCSGPGWIAAGDAAIALDPLASQGIMTALYSGLKAARAIEKTDQGDVDARARYDLDLRNVFAAFRRNRDPFYRMERRWLERRFWKSRQDPA